MHIFLYFLILAGLFVTASLYPQNRVSSSFGAPVDIPILLSGNYGEIRSTHFHAGIDIKTEQVEGKNVLAADSGYVYRVAVSSGGNGKAVYMKHKNGKVTVYCHFSKFHPALERFVKESQYRKKSYEVDLYPKEGHFIFKKGEFIGYSGNTGNSGGPHLHFEVRDQSGSVTYNPLTYGFAIKDKTFPGIKWLMINSLDPRGAVNDTARKLLIPVNGKNGRYVISPDTLKINGKIGIGIETYDYLDNSSNECGPYTISLKLDNRLVFLCRIDSIPFSSAGYVNSHIDYEEKIRSGKKIQKLYIDPNNLLKIYKVAVNRGIIELTDRSVHPVTIAVTDTYGNESILNFYLEHSKDTDLSPNLTMDSSIVARFSYDSLNVFENRDIRVVLPKGALFDNINFGYGKENSLVSIYSAVHKVHNEYTPLFKSYILSLKAKELPELLHAKVLIVNLVNDGTWVSQGGEYKNGFVTTRTKVFGRFILAVDTVSPEIKTKTFIPGANYAENQVISFNITDSLSGIRKLAGYIDKNWALFEYDAKNNLFSYTIDSSKLLKGKLHILEIYATDNKDNVSRYLADFYY